MMPISHRVRRQHPQLFTEAIVLHARQGDRGLSLANSGVLDIEGERGRCHIDAAATPRLSAETCAPARAGSPQMRSMPDDIVDTAKRWERHIGKETGGGMWWRGRAPLWWKTLGEI